MPAEEPDTVYRPAALLVLVSATCLPSQGSWTQARPTTSPPARWQHVMSFDAITGRTVVFGGRPGSNGYLADTWEYDGQTWIQMQTTTQPAPRWLGQMVYDRARLNSVMFGGYDVNRQRMGDTWVWDSLRRTWTQKQPQNSPSARQLAAMAYDPDRQVVVLFGGSSGAYLNDTWEWDGTNWTQINTPNSPSGRTTSMAYDPGRRRMVIFGGEISVNVYDNETWEFDGRTWTQVQPAASPSLRTATAMCFDAVSQRILMFGGFIASFANIDETWAYDGTTWAQLRPAVAPSARRDFDYIVYDSVRQRVRIFGGFANGNAASDETWEYASTQSLTANPGTVSIATGGTQNLSLDASVGNALRSYWVFGSLTGTAPGVALGPVTIPLVPDVWTNLTIALANSPALGNTKGTLDGQGRGAATINVPVITSPSAIGVVLYHAFLAYDSTGYFLASNPVTLRLTR